MGFTTDFIGHIDIDPGLNDAEHAYLDAFRKSRRFDRAGGPYEVPGNPYVDERITASSKAYNRPAVGQPQLWCQWQPCWDGCCLAFDGNEKFYEPVLWLRYIIDHFLRPKAEASRSGLDYFEEFTFDHRLQGLVVGCRRDNKQLYGIRVADNVVTTEVLRPGDARYLDRGPLPYEDAIDSERRSSRQRKSGGGVSRLGVVQGGMTTAPRS